MKITAQATQTQNIKQQLKVSKTQTQYCFSVIVYSDFYFYK